MNNDVSPAANLPASREEQAQHLLSQLTLAEKVGLTSSTQSAVPRLGIGEYHIGSEAAHGVVDREGGHTTQFPLPLGLSQTWNPVLMRRIGEVIGTESRIKYQQSGKSTWLTPWAPTIDVARDPRWGRNEEAYGEDPVLIGELSTELIKGMQGEQTEHLQMAAGPKHFYANNNEVGREDTSNFLPPRVREEYYLAAFRRAFTDAKAQSMMTAYNGINGFPGMQHPDIQGVVKDRWGMDGYVVSDGGALTLNLDLYKYYPTAAEAVADALKKGCDVIVDRPQLVEDGVWAALDQGLLTEADIDKVVLRTLRVRARLGHFDDRNPYDNVDHTLLNSTAHMAVAYQAATESIVLLKNDGVLPLAPESVAVSGPLATENQRDWYAGYGSTWTTVAQAFTATGHTDVAQVITGHDTVTLAVDGATAFLDADGVLRAAPGATPTQFILERWGYGQHALRDPQTLRYVALSDAGHFELNTTELYGWFLKELLADTTSGWLSWDRRPVSIDAHGIVGVASQQDVSNQTNEQALANIRGAAVQQPGAKLQFTVVSDGIAQAVAAAKDARSAVVVLGNHPLINGRETADRPGLDLAAHQLELLQAVAAVNSNTVLVVVGSYPFNLSWAQEHVGAILFVPHGSQVLGEAVRDVVLGAATPTGKLSQTWFTTADLLPDITDYDYIRNPRTYHYLPQGRRDILYPFGFGLTYGELEFVSAILPDDDAAPITAGALRRVAVTVTNAGAVPVTDTVQLYGRVESAEGIALPRKLHDFAKVTVAPGQSQVVELGLAADELTYWDPAAGRFRLPEGQVRVAVGFDSDQELAVFELAVAGERREARVIDAALDVNTFDDYRDAISTINSRKQAAVELQPGGAVSFFRAELVRDQYQLHYEADSHAVLVIGELTIEVAGSGTVTFAANQALPVSGDLTIAAGEQGGVLTVWGFAAVEAEGR